MNPLLSIQGLRVGYSTRSSRRMQSTLVIDDLDLEVSEGETLAIVGESGAGKSTLADAVVGLIPAADGSIRFDGSELVGMRGSHRRRIRSRMQMVAQNPLLALDPRLPVGIQVEEPLLVHARLTRSQRRVRADETLGALDLSSAMRERLPHELSGGQAQRVVLARALILEPSMIIFDEPTSSLDVSVQAGVLNLLQRLKAERSLTYLFITHDLGVARHLADRIAVMRFGELLELQPTRRLFDAPQHEYTRGLVTSSLTV